MERRIFINDTCVGCAFCMLICPSNAIEVFGRAMIDYERCNACMKCTMYCPNSAIIVVDSGGRDAGCDVGINGGSDGSRDESVDNAKPSEIFM